MQSFKNSELGKGTDDMKQYEIRLNKEEKAKFVDAMRIKLSVSNMTVNDLALHMKVPVKTIYNFMAGDSNSRFLAAEIAHFLKIEKKEYRSHSAFFSVLLGTSIGAILGIMAISNHKQRFEVVEKPNQFVHVVDKDKIEEEVFGVDYRCSTVTYNDWVPEMVEMEMTYYTDRGTCADGVTEARKGVCAVQKELIGMTAIIYSMDNELIGIYECCDTGFGRDKDGDGIGTIQEGKTIDVFMDSEDDGWDFIKEHGNRVKVQFVQANG